MLRLAAWGLTGTCRLSRRLIRLIADVPKKRTVLNRDRSIPPILLPIKDS